MPQRKRSIQEDPSIAGIAALEAERVFSLIEDECAKGRPFYHVREEVLALETSRVVEKYGADVGKRMAHGVLCMGPQDMSKRVACGEYRVAYDYWFLRKGGRLGLLDRLCLWLVNAPFYAGKPAPLMTEKTDAK